MIKITNLPKMKIPFLNFTHMVNYDRRKSPLAHSLSHSMILVTQGSQISLCSALARLEEDVPYQRNAQYAQNTSERFRKHQLSQNLAKNSDSVQIWRKKILVAALRKKKPNQAGPKLDHLIMIQSNQSAVACHLAENVECCSNSVL